MPGLTAWTVRFANTKSHSIGLPAFLFMRRLVGFRYKLDALDALVQGAFPWLTQRTGLRLANKQHIN